ncbi:SGNH/GDSL hydrolase family protein [Aurantiacibacter suaedae]|uniref:SGNH/GDSL hydrolase family protein n=1 Tax=Aurantiacibacter suaedae TaxID=2545755 RepID=UPI0010F99D3B|nr:SGNH/GDSL hydrolase family protein [Aurantiacibacter suaedae]
MVRSVPFEADIEAFELVDAAFPPPPCSTLFVGSSSIRMWRSLANDFSDRRVLNRGYGGSTIADTVRFFDRIVTPYAPRAIVFYAGENDLAAGKSPRQVFRDLQALLRLKRERLSDTPMWVVSIKPSPSRWAQREDQVEFNAMARELALEESDVGYIDVASPMLTPAGTPKNIFGADRLHMRASGYRIWTDVIRAALQDVPPPSRCRAR